MVRVVSRTQIRHTPKLLINRHAAYILIYSPPQRGFAPPIDNIHEQLVEQAMSIADDVIVLEHGRNLLTRSAAGIKADDVREVYLRGGKSAAGRA